MGILHGFLWGFLCGETALRFFACLFMFLSISCTKALQCPVEVFCTEKTYPLHMSHLNLLH